METSRSAKTHTRQSALRYPLTAAIGSNAALRVARALFLHGGEMSAPSVIRFTRLSKAGVSQALNTLAKLDVIEELGTARSLLYRVNKAHPLFKPLAELFNAESARAKDIQDAIRSAADREGIIAAWIYGSVARNEDSPDSDLDIVIVARERLSPMVEEAVRENLRDAGEKLVFRPSVIMLDLEDARRLAREQDPWWASLVKDAIVLEGERPEWLGSSRVSEATTNESKNTREGGRPGRSKRAPRKGARVPQGLAKRT